MNMNKKWLVIIFNDIWFIINLYLYILYNLIFQILLVFVKYEIKLNFKSLSNDTENKLSTISEMKNCKDMSN